MLFLEKHCEREGSRSAKPVQSRICKHFLLPTMVPVAQYRTMERSSQEDLKKTDAVFVSCLLWGVGLFRDGWNLLRSFHVFFRNQAVEASLAVFSGCWH